MRKKDKCAYLVETRYRAGVYDRKSRIINNKYLKNAIVEEFPSVDDAVVELNRRYDDITEREGLDFNHLYQVRDDHDYVVFSNGFVIGFCRADLYWKTIERIEWQMDKKMIAPFDVEGGYTYKEAQVMVAAISMGITDGPVYTEGYKSGIGYAIPGQKYEPSFFEKEGD